MTIHLGETDSMAFDFSTGYVMSENWPATAPAPDCNTDTTLWVRAMAENGRCYAVCTADPSQSFEVSTEECRSGRSTQTARPAQTDSGQIVKGVPNWVLAVAGFALFVAMNN